MSSKTLLIVGLAVLACPPALQAQEGKLAFLIPTLYGPRGLIVDSEARLPDGSTHSAHFNSAFQAEFTQFNVALASQLASVPLPSPASGFTYELDPTLGVFKRSTQSFGPILADRAETIGRKKVSFGLNFQSFSFDTLEGIDLDHVPAVFTHDDAAPGGRADVVATDNSIDLRASQLISYLSYGLTDRIDVSVAVPIVNADLSVVSDATLRRIGTAASPATHFFRDAAGGFSTEKVFSSSHSASGIGDVIGRIKIQPFKTGAAGFAIGVEGRFPTGDEENLLGSGAYGVKPFVIFSLSKKLLSPHLNLGYQWNGDSVLAGDVLTGEKKSLPDQFFYAVGVDIGVSPQLTLALDVIGRRMFDTPRIETETFHALDGSSTFPTTHFLPNSDFNITNGAVGVKINVSGKLLLDLNMMFKMDEAGLRDKLTPLFGFEYSF
jgi:hypothetical protein